MKVAAVTGDDVTELVRASDPILLETGEPLSKLGTDIISTNAYLGADAIAAAYAAGADVIVTGRVTDSRARARADHGDARLEAGRSRRDGVRRAHRASARMRRAGDRRIFRRARPEGRAGCRPHRLSDRGDARRSLDHHHQAAGQRRADRSPHHRRADPLRDARSRRLHHARRDARRHRSRSRGDRRATKCG